MGAEEALEVPGETTVEWLMRDQEGPLGIAKEPRGGAEASMVAVTISEELTEGKGEFVEAANAEGTPV